MASEIIVPRAGEVYDAETLPRRRKGFATAGIYAIRCVPTGKLYIGSSIHLERRLAVHRCELLAGRHKNPHLLSAWTKRGPAAFRFEVLEIVIQRESLIDREQHWIDRLKPAFNAGGCAANPMLGRRHSAAAIAKMSAALTGKKYGPRTFCPEHRAALRIAALNRPPVKLGPLSAEAKANMSAAAKRRYEAGAKNPRTRPVEIDGVSYGSVQHAARELKLRAATIISRIKRGFGRYLDDPASRQIRTWSRSEFTGENHGNARAVIVDGICYGTRGEAARSLGLHTSSIAYWIKKGRAHYADQL